jgi:hypothetical protein
MEGELMANVTEFADQMLSTSAELEQLLRSLLRGKHSSLSLSFNEGNGPNYQTVAEEDEDGSGHGDWISEAEREKGIRENSKWVLQWYPETPVGFCALAASSLPALIEAVRDHLKENPDG